MSPNRTAPDVGRVEIGVSEDSSVELDSSLFRLSPSTVLVDANGVDLRSPALKLLDIRLLPPSKELVLLFRGSKSVLSFAAGVAGKEL